MGIRIHQLPPLIANQIAAGEVIERPASVVKELLENALDAAAHAITIEVGYGGLNQIKISDNGVGIFAEDLPLAISAHATSKINTLNDLYAINSMGFRGEALASIASIAKLSISSRPVEQETAMMLQVQGTDIHLAPCARAVGTTIDVVDLFFNAPVRKRFLKGEKLEFQAIESVVKRFALSAPQIAITLKHNGKLILDLPAVHNEAAQMTRMARIMGSAFMKEAIFLDVERGGMRLWGWISNANFQRSQNDRQWVYVNQRMVKDKLLNHALKQAYEGILHPGRFPACVVYFTLSHAEVDVNVHPTKHEVRFQQPRLVHDFFVSQLSAALQTSKEPEIEMDYAPQYAMPGVSGQAVCEPYPQLEGLNSHKRHWQPETNWVVLTTHYIMAFIAQQPYVVDLFALHQEMLQEQFAQHGLPLASRPLLVPVTYTLSAHLRAHWDELHRNLKQLGIELELQGAADTLVRTLPMQAPYFDLRMFLDAVSAAQKADLDSLWHLFNQAHVFDPLSLSADEKMEFNQFLLKMHAQEHKRAGLFKRLTREDCRNLLYV